MAPGSLRLRHVGMSAHTRNMLSNELTAPRTPEEFQRRIEAIERLDASGAPITDLVDAIRGLNRGTRFGLPHVPPGSKFYRASLHHSVHREKALIHSGC